MNVAYVSHYFLPYSIGGVEEYTFDSAQAVIERGHKARVFHGVIEQEDWREYEVRESSYESLETTAIKVDLEKIQEFAGTWRQEAVDQAFREFLEKHPTDIVHIQHLTRLSLGIVEIAKAHGIPTVLTLHDYWMQCARGQRVRPDGDVCHEIDEERCARCMAIDVDYIDGRKSTAPEHAGTLERHVGQIRLRRSEMLEALHQVDALSTVSDFTRRSFLEYGVSRDISLLRPGADAEVYESRSLPETLVRFGFVGRLTETKGIRVLLQAFRAVQGSAELHLYGPGDAACVDAAKEAATHDPRIHVHGEFHRSQVAEVYSSFDLLVVPSTWFECSPLVLQEARNFGKPVLVSNIGGLTELVRDGEDGLLFRAGDPVSLGEQLTRLAKNPERVRELAGNVKPPRPRKEHWDALEQLYGELVAG